jgi:hypothetical protein
MNQYLNIADELEQFDLEEFDGLLQAYIQTPADPELNWKLALWYHENGQHAPAVGFYIRTVERIEDDTLWQYECMIRAAMCFDAQGIRKFSVKGMLQHAIALRPERPEAYYMLGKITSNEGGDGNWFDSYTWATLGLRAADSFAAGELELLRTDVDYPGRDSIAVQHAAAAWWCGMCDESRKLFLALWAQPELDSNLKQLVKTNLIQLNAFCTKEIQSYQQNMHKDLRVKFDNSKLIRRNFSESYQDMFVLAATGGKREGKYVEVGAGNAEYGNNTVLLEREYAWKGISLELDEGLANNFNAQRANPCVIRDATGVNYTAFLDSIFDGEREFDYLQLDCEPAATTYKILLNIPFEEFKFATITYEHDHYTDPDDSYRAKSRKYLESYGYVLVAGNISPDDSPRPYEDWYVHPDLVSAETIEQLMQKHDDTKSAESYMMGRE